jgi:GNAT superfamily N-acetyltransferase
MRIRELTEETLPLLEALFGPNGAVAGCWCMWFRQTHAEWTANAGEPNRRMLVDLVKRGQPVGLLAVDDDDRPRGWVAVSPRLAQPRLANSKVTAPADPTEDLTDVWCVTCLFLHRTARRQGLSGPLVRAAVDYAARHGAVAVEAYPVDTQPGRRYSSGELFHGTVEIFSDAGFELVQRRGARRAFMRRRLPPDPPD